MFETNNYAQALSGRFVSNKKATQIYFCFGGMIAKFD
jgi:hypothetical protein